MLSNIYGMNIISSEYIPEKRPKLQLSYKVNLSSEFRNEFDNWLLEMFGTESVAYVFDNNIAMNPKNIAAFKVNT